MKSDEHQQNEKGLQLRPLHGKLVTCRVEELRPHPSYARHQFTVPASKLSALIERAGFAFDEPLVITRDHTIIDGYARWELARQQGRTTLSCIEYDLSEEEALLWLLDRHRRSNGLNDFSRILVALELEPWFKEKAQANQRAGGQLKGSSKLTEATTVDVREKIAQAAHVSVGNVSKVRQITTAACPQVQEAVLRGEVSIHRAWLWSKEASQEQQKSLWRYGSERGVKKKIRELISRHLSKDSPTVPDLSDLNQRLSRLGPDQLSSVGIAVIDMPGKGLFLTRELFQALEAQGELSLTCSTNSH